MNKTEQKLLDIIEKNCTVLMLEEIEHQLGIWWDDDKRYKNLPEAVEDMMEFLVMNDKSLKRKDINSIQNLGIAFGLYESFDSVQKNRSAFSPRSGKEIKAYDFKLNGKFYYYEFPNIDKVSNTSQLLIHRYDVSGGEKEIKNLIRNRRPG